jgi:hydrogenase nickel incorporation protein HypB
MCATCGCGEVEHEHEHGHDHVHEHDHANVRVRPAAAGAVTIPLGERVLAKNQRLADGNRRWFAERAILALNLVSSPGAGKTTLLERTVRDLGTAPIYVVEGDQATDRDAARIRAAGARAVQVNTGAGCHLDAHQVAHALDELAPPPGALCFVENVGNLVCPALFDLGERAKVVVASVTEGDDKPLKYPHMFRAAALMLLNKIDLLPHVQFSVERCVAYARDVNPAIEVLEVSATRGDGLPAWYDWLARARAAAAQGAA